MPSAKARAIVVKASDWSETSRIATLWTREFGKVRVLAKGGKRLRSNFEVALDLLTVCSIVLLRKPSGGLELLTEARVEERFPGLRTNLRALYVGYYLAELLGTGTQDYDPHPALFDATLDVLRRLSDGGDPRRLAASYEMTWLAESGFQPELSRCTVCRREEPTCRLCYYSPTAGGVTCADCAGTQPDRRSISGAALATMRDLARGEMPSIDSESRSILSHTVSSILGRRPRLSDYLGS